MRRHVFRAPVVVGLAVACMAATAGNAFAAGQQSHAPIYLNPAYSPHERAADLVSRMTLREKAAEMVSSQAAAIPRLGVRAYGWWNEAAHGVAREQTRATDGGNPEVLTNTTSYPVDLAMGSTWDPKLMYRVATQVSGEAREVAPENTLDLNYYSPTVNLSRDPRWGRNDETFSEDPLLTTAMAAQYVNGMEGKDGHGNPLPKSDGYLKTSTTLKHFAANNSEFNRLTGNSAMDERTLREYYTKQFRGIVRRSHPGSIMSSYNSVNGVPSAANTHLMRDLARRTFGFDGFFTSDCDAVYEIQHGHHYRPPNYDHPLNAVERNAYANAAGEDLNCSQGYHDKYNFANTLPQAAREKVRTAGGEYTENNLDASLVRLFTARIKLGEFADGGDVPWVRQARARVPKGTWTNSDANHAVTETSQRLKLARHAADQSIVLLKNDATGHSGSRLLPVRVPKSGKFRVAVIGNHANPDEMYLGGYASNQGAAGQANEVNGYHGIKQAIQRIDPDATVDYLPGIEPGTKNTLDSDSVAKSAKYDTVIVYAGTDATTAKEGQDRSSLKLPAPQTSLIEQVAAKNPNTIVYLETMGEVDVSGFADDVPAMLWSSYNGMRKGEALADVLLGQYNPSGHLPFTWYRDGSQLPPIGDYGIRPTGSQHGRTYMYFDGTASYPFGYGLSYTDFRYSQPRFDRSHVNANGAVHVSADVTNTGDRAGSDVAQLYVAGPAADQDQLPDRRLVGFRHVTLRPHQTKHISFTVHIPDLAIYSDKAGHELLTTGRYKFQLGESGGDRGIRQTAGVTVTGKLRPSVATVTATPLAQGDHDRGVTTRTIYDRGAVVVPRTSVAMSDDTLYGAAATGPCTALPPGMHVAYRSNRPRVVDVDRGTLRTRHSGVATVTATVRYHGTRSTTSFVIDVR